MTGDGTVDLLGFRSNRVKGGVDLKLPVDLHRDAEFVSFVARHFSGCFHLGHGWVLTRHAFTRVAKQSHIGFCIS